jgi:hypothetical protein
MNSPSSQLMQNFLEQNIHVPNLSRHQASGQKCFHLQLLGPISSQNKQRIHLKGKETGQVCNPMQKMNNYSSYLCKKIF